MSLPPAVFPDMERFVNEHNGVWREVVVCDGSRPLLWHGDARVALVRARQIEPCLSALGFTELMRVGGPVQVNALTRAFGGGVDDLQAQVRRNFDHHTLGQLKLTGLILDIGEPVDVELEDLGRILHTEPIAGA